MLEKWDYEYAIQKISKEVIKAYEEKIVNISKDTNGQVDYRQVERNELLRAVDKNWIDHIDAMDQLRKGIGLRGYAQQDPVIAYKQEGHEMFEEMIDRIQMTTISRLLKGKIVKVQPQPRQIPIQEALKAAGININGKINGNISINGNTVQANANPANGAAPTPAAQGNQNRMPNFAPGMINPPKPINDDGDFVPKGTIIHRPKQGNDDNNK
jgi:preprotein translocase subunit SecA